MSIFPKSISWSEPWDWGLVKTKVKQAYGEMPPLWRMVAYCLIVFGILAAVRIIYPETQEHLTWWRTIFAPMSVFLLFYVFLPCVASLPNGVQISEKGVFFQCGGSASVIEVKNLISLSFETRDGRRWFVVKARNRRGLPFERLALMTKKKITEEDVRRFLYDVNLAHLYAVPEDDARESEGFRQDLQD